MDDNTLEPEFQGGEFECSSRAEEPRKYNLSKGRNDNEPLLATGMGSSFRIGAMMGPSRLNDPLHTFELETDYDSQPARFIQMLSGCIGCLP